MYCRHNNVANTIQATEENSFSSAGAHKDFYRRRNGVSGSYSKAASLQRFLPALRHEPWNVSIKQN